MNPLSITIAGRNEAAASSIITKMNQINSKGIHKFKHIDLTKIKECQKLAKEWKDPLHGLVITAGIMRFSGRQETPEGLDAELATHYYGRWSLIRDFMPLMEETAKSSPQLSVRYMSLILALYRFSVPARVV
jgi:NAD(P)-dependent dehydrogenase (short-subunit alcohol dehydrogenase family)